MFLSFSRGLSWGFETALYYELRLSVPSSSPQQGRSGNRLCLILPTFILPTYLPTCFHVLSTHTCLHTYLFIYLHTYSAVLIICLFKALYLFSYLVLCTYSVLCFSLFLSPAFPFLLFFFLYLLRSVICPVTQIVCTCLSPVALFSCTADSSWGCLPLWRREPVRTGCARSVG